MYRKVLECPCQVRLILALFLRVLVWCLACSFVLKILPDFLHFYSYYLVPRNIVLSKLSRKARFFHASQYTYWTVHGKSQHKLHFFYDARVMTELGNWVNLTALGVDGYMGSGAIVDSSSTLKKRMTYTCIRNMMKVLLSFKWFFQSFVIKPSY